MRGFQARVAGGVPNRERSIAAVTDFPVLRLGRRAPALLFPCRDRRHDSQFDQSGRRRLRARSRQSNKDCPDLCGSILRRDLWCGLVPGERRATRRRRVQVETRVAGCHPNLMRCAVRAAVPEVSDARYLVSLPIRRCLERVACKQALRQSLAMSARLASVQSRLW